MKYSLLIIALITVTNVTAQKKEKLSNAYLSIMAHGDQPGVSLVNSFGIIKYIGIGAGAELTKYNDKVLVPAFLDLRLKYPIKKAVPFILGQFGKPLYRRNDVMQLRDSNGQFSNTLDEVGRYFFGGGVGFHYNFGKIGVFASYSYRHVELKYKGDSPVPASMPVNFNTGFNVLNVGITL